MSTGSCWIATQLSMLLQQHISTLLSSTFFYPSMLNMFFPYSQRNICIGALHRPKGKEVADGLRKITRNSIARQSSAHRHPACCQLASMLMTLQFGSDVLEVQTKDFLQGCVISHRGKWTYTRLGYEIMILQSGDSRYTVGVCFSAYHSGPIWGTGALARPVKARWRSKGIIQRSKGGNCGYKTPQLWILITSGTPPR